MEKYLFIAEKPSLMRETRTVYNKYKNEIDSKIGGEIVFTALAGHVCGFALPDAYPEWNKPWKDIVLPMMPEDWKIGILKNKNQLYKDITDAFKNNNCTALIVATDADTEGNGIFYLLENRAGWTKKKALRFFIEKDLTEKSIKSAFLNMKDHRTNPRDVRMTECYLVRAHKDWLYGMNFSVKASVMSGVRMRIGRVKAPVMKMVYDNSMAIDNFVPKTSYLVVADYKEGFDGTYITDEDGKPVQFEKESDALRFISSIKGNKGIVKDVSKKTVKTSAPQLYKLSDLQAEAGSKYGLSPTEVLDLVQSLYEKKYMSYPRTDGRYISTEKAKELPEVLAAIATFPEMTQLVNNIPEQEIKNIVNKKNYVNDKEVEKKSHDALLPTTVKPDFSKLSVSEKNIYLMVAKRLVSIFYPPLAEEKTVILVDVEGNTFKSNGTVVAEPGWTLVVPKKKEGVVLPVVNKGQVLSIDKLHTKERTTTPPKRLTLATLVTAMETIGNTFEEDEYKSIMKESSGIGTPSSRGKIIDDLIETQYIDVKKNALYISDLGKEYVEGLLGYDIIDPKMTAELEIQLKGIREGSTLAKDVSTLMDNHMFRMLAQMDSMKMFKTATAYGNSHNQTSEYKCPICGGGMTESEKCCSCNSCDFKLWKIVAGKALNKTQVRDLLTRGETSGPVKGMLNSNKEKFDAKLKLEDGKIIFDFGSGLFCPECGSELRKMDWGYGCTGYTNGCKFSISNNYSGKRFSERDLVNLLNGKTIGPYEFTSHTKGTKFNAKISFVKEYDRYKMMFVFDNNNSHNNSKNSASSTNNNETKLCCPECGKPLRKMNWGYGCTGYSDGCKFSISNSYGGKKFSDDDIAYLLNGNVMGPCEFVSQTKGTTYKAKLSFGKDGDNYKFKLEFQ